MQNGNTVFGVKQPISEPIRISGRARFDRSWLAVRAWLVLCALCAGLPALGWAQDVPKLTVDAAAQRLRSKGYVVMMRHAQTVPGIGDPEHFKLDDCATQRNLSDEGRDQARKLASAFKRAGIRFDFVRSSQWCRCRETARIVFGSDEVWPVLNSTFRNRAEQPDRAKKITEFAQQLSSSHNAILVTHQLMIAPFVGTGVDSSELIAFRFEGGQLKPQFRLQPP